MLIAVAVVVIVALGGFLLLRGGQKNETKTSATSQTTTTNSSPNPSSSEQSSANTITYSGNKFSPENLTVNSGETVTVMNKGSDTIQVASKPHPAHTDNIELNVGTIAPGETKTFTLTKAGSWGYHNHLESSEGGTIIVR